MKGGGGDLGGGTKKKGKGRALKPHKSLGVSWGNQKKAKNAGNVTKSIKRSMTEERKNA